MKRFQSILCASFLALALSSTTFAGDISGGKTVTAAGDISGGKIATAAGDISGGKMYDYIFLFLAQMAL